MHAKGYDTPEYRAVYKRNARLLLAVRSSIDNGNLGPIVALRRALAANSALVPTVLPYGWPFWPPVSA